MVVVSATALIRQSTIRTYHPHVFLFRAPLALCAGRGRDLPLAADLLR
jgi:hypothetical protein